jgi:hypothetical protein
MLLTLGDRDNRARTAYREYAQRYPGRYPDTNVFRLLQQRLRDTGSLTPPARASVGRPLSVRAPATEDAITTAVERELREAHVLSQGNWDCPKHWTLTYFMVMKHVHSTIRRTSISSYMVFLYGCSSANVCVSNALLMSSMKIFFRQTRRVFCMRESSKSTSITSGHELILMLPVHVDIKFLFKMF